MTRLGPSSQARPACAGFMLVEMLVAMAVGAFLLVALASVTAFIIRAHGRASAQAAALEDASRILAALSREIRSSVWIRWSGERPSLIFVGRSDQLVFARDSVSDDGSEATQVLRFQGLPLDGGTRLVRSVASLAPNARSPDDLAWSTPTEVYRGRNRIAFAYFAAGSGSQVLTDDWTRTDRRPVAVQVSLIPTSPAGEMISIRVPLLVDAGPECAQRQGKLCGGLGGADTSSETSDASQEPVDADDAQGWERYGR